VPDFVAQSDLADWTRFGVRIGDNDVNNVFSRAIAEMFINGEALEVLEKHGLHTRNLTAVTGA
jgi:hypothetical protein